MKTILIADDEYAILDTMEIILVSAGYRVATAANGEELLQMVRQAMPDLIILDVMMPVLNGIDVLKTLRGQPETMQLPVIMISGAYLDEELTRLGWSRWMDKPFHMDALLRAVGDLIGPASAP